MNANPRVLLTGRDPAKRPTGDLQVCTTSPRESQSAAAMPRDRPILALPGAFCGRHGLHPSRQAILPRRGWMTVSVQHCDGFRAQAPQSGNQAPSSETSQTTCIEDHNVGVVRRGIRCDRFFAGTKNPLPRIGYACVVQHRARSSQGIAHGQLLAPAQRPA